MIFLELAESFKTMNRPDSTMTLLGGLFLGEYVRYEPEIWKQSLLKSSICVIKIWIDVFDSLETMRFLAT